MVCHLTESPKTWNPQIGPTHSPSPNLLSASVGLGTLRAALGAFPFSGPHAPDTSQRGPPASFPAHHEAPRLALSRKSPPCPSQAHHPSPFPSCWHGLMQQEVSGYRTSCLSQPHQLPQSTGPGTGKETETGKALSTLHMPQC